MSIPILPAPYTRDRGRPATCNAQLPAATLVEYAATAGRVTRTAGGYLHLKGNIYKYNSQHTPIITNTSLMYKLYENEFTIGNVNEPTELPLFGRGAKAIFSNKEKAKRLRLERSIRTSIWSVRNPGSLIITLFTHRGVGRQQYGQGCQSYLCLPKESV